MPSSLTQLSLRTARHDWRGGLALVAGAFLCSALLTGAFATGQGIRRSLAEKMSVRSAGNGHLIYTGDRFFTDSLGARSSPADGVSAHMLLPGSIASADGTRRANQIQVIGTNNLHIAGEPHADAAAGVVINNALAISSGLKVGAEVVVRVANPGALPRDTVFSTEEDQTVAIRKTVTGITDEGLASFSLRADLSQPRIAMVSLSAMQEALLQPGRANLLLAPPGAAPKLNPTLADFGLHLATNGVNTAEIITSRIFLPPEVEAAADLTGAVSAKIFTYFATALKSGTNACPYSTVCAIEQFGEDNPILPATLKPGEVVINDWLAADLGVKAGDPLSVGFLRMSAQRKFQQDEKSFVIGSVVPMKGLAADRSLMPEFPGMADADNCRDWKAGLPVDFGKVRGKDEKYWEDHKGTPKAFISLAAGRELWGGSFGSLTAIRFDLGKKSLTELETTVRRALPPEIFGLTWIDLQGQSAAAIKQGMDFGGLFAGMSFFLIMACLALAGMFAGWQIEERRPQIALFRSIGFTAGRVRRLLLAEAGCFILAGSMIGPLAGLGYATWLCTKIGGEWSGAVQGLSGSIRPEGGWLQGFVATVLLMGTASGIRVHRATRGEVRNLLAPTGETTVTARKWLGGLALIAAVGAVGLAFASRTSSASAQPGLLFGAGALALISGLALMRYVLKPSLRALASLGSLAASNLRRTGGKGTVTAGVLAAGLFMVGSAGAFRQDAHRDADDAYGGTGGFHWIMEATVPVLQDLNDAERQEELGLEESGLRVVPFRVQSGDEASCLNLMRAQKPRVLGVDGEALSGHFRFVSNQTPYTAAPWLGLGEKLEDGLIPAIADMNSLMWAMHKKPGDIVEITAEDGSTAKLLLVGAVNNTVLQGSLIIGEEAFRRLFPSTSGHRWFLVEENPRTAKSSAEGAIATPTRTLLERGLREWGVEVTPAIQRLAEFHAVQNTYIDIFQVLGGLGVALGAAGLAAVTLRNLSRRRRELAVMQAQGFPLQRLRRMAWIEHAVLLICGLGIGIVAALFSIAPAPGGLAGVVRLTIPAACIVLIGCIGIWLAIRLVTRGSLLARVRSDD